MPAAWRIWHLDDTRPTSDKVTKGARSSCTVTKHARRFPGKLLGTLRHHPGPPSHPQPAVRQLCHTQISSDWTGPLGGCRWQSGRRVAGGGVITPNVRPVPFPCPILDRREPPRKPRAQSSPPTQKKDGDRIDGRPRSERAFVRISHCDTQWIGQISPPRRLHPRRSGTCKRTAIAGERPLVLCVAGRRSSARRAAS